jgi:hypothetical protein
MGPIKGDMSIAPMITTVEFILSPTEAIILAKIKIQRFVPLKIIPFLISLYTASGSSSSDSKLKKCKNFLIV